MIMYCHGLCGIWAVIRGQFVPSQVCAAWRGSLGDGLQLDVERNGVKMFVCFVCIYIYRRCIVEMYSDVHNMIPQAFTIQL